jgi:manganese transport protein
MVAPRWLTAIAVVIALIIAGLNIKLVFGFVLG